MDHPTREADWTSFVLHYIFGLFLGGGLGVFAFTRGNGKWLSEDFFLLFVSGAAFLSAGVGAKWGDRLWMSFSESTFGSDAPRHSRLSAWLCSLSIIAGASFVGTSLFKQFYHQIP